MSGIRGKRTLGIFALGIVALLALGCAASPPPGELVVERRPPPDRVEVMGVAPAGHVWIGGHWRWAGNDYDWVPGRWAPMERGFRHWVPGHWVHARRGWSFVEGHWRR